MNDFILMKEVELEVKILFENTLLYAQGNRIRSYEDESISYIPTYDKNREIKTFGNWSESNNIGSILDNYISNKEDENIKLYAVVELKKLIYNFCINFFNSNNFYNNTFIDLYEFSNLPDLTNFSTKRDINISLSIIRLKDFILYAITENDFNIICKINRNEITLEDFKRTEMKSYIKENSKINHWEIFFPNNLKFSSDEEIENILNENILLKFDYFIVKNLVQYFIRIQNLYFKLKYKIKFAPKVIEDTISDEDFELFYKLIKDHLANGSKNNFKNYLQKGTTNKVYFNSTFGNLCFILLTLEEKYKYLKNDNTLIIVKKNKDETIFTRRKYSVYRANLLSENGDKRISAELYNYITNSPFSSPLINGLEKKIKS